MSSERLERHGQSSIQRVATSIIDRP
jgi:hypothetical protein